jgi:YHS domain-containing protein
MKEVNPMAKDPVCGMMVDEEKAAATSEYKGKTYYFGRPAARLPLTRTRNGT